ncbi:MULTISPECIES: Fe-S cluster assembly protein SufB [Stenotrophomonas]|jgi:Fe-S cluster assembly protein SufB|uniref:Fe-S cluster assembly protein SufB n=1 Tax=Stenotrophomonas TaxID=40323 RepID=UPI000702D774|nr:MULTISPECIES: Fe-S cluster assembly protein SufB [Stenotrophomonas]OZB54067.1 MAG: Fe-S cluster assembly protein SufB [Stenotrophomonas sp. 14-69-23]KRG86388.1 cysteine desulfurase [Stenotrophomonas acidaminiphila]MCA7022979.1 Fe-S cluster assembly protein SufB [Stenotrophomonas acidaminiphila]MCE4075011.1 Fe-S cluster assembly protein SufB [Stenotrophomonas acidaminiphila]QOF97782.1 Fe-S cluster assembly protein SufB [Stenotrophomonas sp. CW117]
MATETTESVGSADTPNREIHEQLGRKYEAGFVTEIESESFPPGLDEDIIRALSAKKDEPEWMTQWRLDAYRHFLTMRQPDWAKLQIGPIDLQALSYYSAPKGPKYKSLDEVPKELLDTYDKLGVPLHERAKLAGVAVDAVFDSVSVGTTFRKELADKGVIFCSISEAIREYPGLVRQYLGSVVPVGDNYFAALNSAVFSDGSFVFVPKGVRCPMELSTYFRINANNTGQFERTLIICEDKGHVSYLEGCTAPMRDENQLHAAVVELVALEDAEIKYSTVQNWYPGDENGVGGIYNFVTKRAECRGARSKVTWTQVETGSAITWKYPSCVLLGDDSVGEFHSVALTHHRQQADTGTKMIHVGKRTKSKIVSKGISAGHGQNTYRGLVKVAAGAEGARNYTQCDSLLIGKKCGAHTFPYIEVKNPAATVEHEATTSKISDDQLFYCRARGIDQENAVSMIVDGFCKQVFKELPMEFAVEAKKLLEVSLEGSVG